MANLSSFDRFKFIGSIKKGDEFHKVYTNDHMNSEIHTALFTLQSGNNYFNVEAQAFKPKSPYTKIKYFETGDKTAKEVNFGDRINVNTSNLDYRSPKFIDLVADERFVHPYDFVMKIVNLLSSDQFKGFVYKVEGRIQKDYYTNKKGDRAVATKYIADLIEIMTPGTKPESEVSLNLYLDGDCITRIDTDLAILTGKSVQKARKKNPDGTYGYESFDVSVELDLGKDNPDAVFDIFRRMYQGGTDKLKKIGFICEQINGSQEIAVTEDMLTDDERELIKLGMATLEEYQEAYGNGKGEFERRTKRIKDKRGYGGGAVDTEITLADIDTVVKEESIVNPTPDNFKSAEDDDLPF